MPFVGFVNGVTKPVRKSDCSQGTILSQMLMHVYVSQSLSTGLLVDAWVPRYVWCGSVPVASSLQKQLRPFIEFAKALWRLSICYALLYRGSQYRGSWHTWQVVAKCCYASTRDCRVHDTVVYVWFNKYFGLYEIPLTQYNRQGRLAFWNARVSDLFVATLRFHTTKWRLSNRYRLSFVSGRAEFTN